MATGGVYSLMDAPGAVQFSVDEIRVMVEEADHAGIRGVLAHAENAAGIKNAVLAGIRSVEHGDGIDDEAIDLMLERDVPLVPTFLITEEMLREDRVKDGVTPPWAVTRSANCWRRSTRGSATPSSAGSGSRWARTEGSGPTCRRSSA